MRKETKNLTREQKLSTKSRLFNTEMSRQKQVSSLKTKSHSKSNNKNQDIAVEDIYDAENGDPNIASI